jgi:apolipoprotein N-acyltransferase
VREASAARPRARGWGDGSAVGSTGGVGRALLAAVLAGAVLYAAHPPLALRVLAFLVAPLLIVALRLAGGGDARDRHAGPPSALVAGAIGSLAGIVGFGPMIVWLVAPAGLIGWSLLMGIQALWLGLWALLVAPWLRSHWLPLVAGGLWVGIDTLRGQVPLSGFGWGTLAYSQAGADWFTPLGRLLGAHGITFAVVVLSVAGLESLLALWGGDREHPPRSPLVQLVGMALLTTLVTVSAPATEGSLDVVAVQGNDIRHWIEQPPAAPRVIATNLRDLTLDAIARDGRPDLVVWPESAIDRDPSSPQWADLGELARESAAAAGLLVTGVALDGPDPARERIIGALLMDGSGEIDRYVKRRLVPFGEYVPARRWLSWFPPLDQIPRDAVAGEGARSFQVGDGIRVAVAICFETLYSDLVRTNVRADERDAGLILAITNDASFQDSAEPAQHLAQSRMRAIETGRWVVHAALSGSSAFVDPDGRVHDATDLFTATSIRHELPLAVAPTPFLRTGDLVGKAGVALILILLLLRMSAVTGRWYRSMASGERVARGR